MTSIAPEKTAKTHNSGAAGPECLLWFYSNGQAAPSGRARSLLAELTWSQWSPAPAAAGTPSAAAALGRSLQEFLHEHPGRSILLLDARIRLTAAQAQQLVRLGLQLETRDLNQADDSQAGQPARPLALTLFSNTEDWLNPFSGLPTDALVHAESASQEKAPAERDADRCMQDASQMISWLGSGVLHQLDRWPAHLLWLNAAAIEALAQPDLTAATALERLRDMGGACYLADTLFAGDPALPLAPPLQLEPHEEYRPPAWGDLVARLAHWLQPQPLRALQALAGEPAPLNLHITHSWGGGVARWVESYIQAASAAAQDHQSDSCQPEWQLQLCSEGPRSGAGAGQRLSLYLGNQLKVPLASWWLQPAIRSTTDDNPQYRDILNDIVERYGVSRVMVSSLVGHSLDALATGLPTVQVLHDFFPAWPLLGVHPQAYLAAPADQRLSQALQDHPLLPDFTDHSAAAWNRLARVWPERLAAHSVRLAAPSQSVIKLLAQLDPRFAELDIEIIHHGLPPLVQAPGILPRPRPDGRLRLVVPGRMQPGKGASLLLAALPQLRQYAQVYLLGAGKHGEVFFGQAGVNVVLQYQRDELPELMRTIAPDVAALLSVVPETFSYTLSEMQQLGIPVIATRVGSLAERIQHGTTGWLIDTTPQALVEQVRQLAGQPELLADMRSRSQQADHFSDTAMVGRYQQLCPVQPRQPALARMPRPQAAQLAALAVQKSRLEASLQHSQAQIQELEAEVEQRTEWALERDRALQHEQQRRERWVARLQADIESLHGIIDQQKQDLQLLDSVLASSSWRLTRPLRAGRRLLQNLHQARAWNPARWPLLISQAIRTISTQGLGGALQRAQQTAQRSEPPPRALAGNLAGELGPIGNPEPPAALPCPDQPLVSIVIPVFNKWPYTAACLRSLMAAETRASFEVIVVDDHSTDETGQRLQQIEGVNHLRNPSNLGFVLGCNRGMEAARGKYTVLLNNDTQVLDGWLDALLDTFERFPDTGLAGARLVYPDGRMQESGGIIFNDGSGWNYGRGEPADRPEYAYVREVDYCSGACIMLPTALVQQLGGLDERYAPAYYEDTDLAFRVREAGLKVRVQGAATIIHHEGISSGTDINTGVKRYQQVNRKKFLQRWSQQLGTHPAPLAGTHDQAGLRAARDHRLRGRVLMIDAYTPEPDQDSGSLRLRYLFDCFAQLGYGVTFFADNRGFAGRYSSELQKSGVEVLYNPWIESLQDFFRQRGGEFDLVFISRHYVAANYLSLIRKYCPRARFIFDTVDLHYLREQRLAELEDSLPLKRVAAQTRRSELAVIREADATLVVSPVEQKVLADDAPEARVHVLSNIHQVADQVVGYAPRQDIFFVGGYQHPPNIDAAQWFVSSIWPLIRQQLPDMQFHLIGSKAPDSIRALHGNGVVFHGFVPDLQPWLDGCRLAVAPLRYGAGVKGKVNLSMAHGQPVVATPIAVEGLQAVPGQDVLVAEDAAGFAAEVVRLYRDQALWERLASGGMANVQRHFSVATARDNLAELLRQLSAD